MPVRCLTEELLLCSSPVTASSALDLAAAARCQYALLREFDAKLAGDRPSQLTTKTERARAAVLGSAHEGRRLGPTAPRVRRRVVALSLAGRLLMPAGWRHADATRRAIANHAPVVYQAAMFDGRFVGFADS